MTYPLTLNSADSAIRECSEAVSRSDRFLRADGDTVSDTHALAERILKIQEELGETTQAYIGYVGQNARKGFTHNADDVRAELIDVITTAFMALELLNDGPARYNVVEVALREVIRKCNRHSDAVANMMEKRIQG